MSPALSAVPLAFLISNGERPNSTHLASQLAEHFRLRVVEPVFVTTETLLDSDVVDQNAFRARHLRSATTGEVGCAIAHRNALSSFLETSDAWCLVFEDDARIEAVCYLRERSKVYASVFSQERPTLVNLNENAVPTRPARRPKDAPQLSVPPAPPYPATAYAINRAAAALFVSQQTPIRSQADWPRTVEKVWFYVDQHSSVTEDTDIASSIDAKGERSLVSIGTKLSVWSGTWFVLHRAAYGGLRNYWRWLILPRLAFHGDTLLARFSSILRH